MDTEGENVESIISHQTHEVFVHDAGVSVAEVQEAGVQWYLIRGRENCTARRNELPPRKERGHPPEDGVLVHPLPRRYRGRTLSATLPDEEQALCYQGREICAQRKPEEAVTMMFIPPPYPVPLTRTSSAAASP